MCAKAYARLWILRKLDPLGVSQSQLLDVYEKQVMVKYASLVWTVALTRNEIIQIVSSMYYISAYNACS